MALLNYVIGAWSGKRRGSSRRGRSFKRYRDPCCNLRAQLSTIERFGNGVGKVTVVVPHNPEEPSKYGEFLDYMRDRLTVPVVILRRENFGFAVGSYIHAYRNDDESDYFLFIEDDYVIVLDGWVNRLIDILEDGKYTFLLPCRKQQIMGIGLTDRKSISTVDQDGRLLVDPRPGGVRAWGELFMKGAADLSQSFRTLYLRGNGVVKKIGKGPTLFVPAEVYEEGQW